MSSAVLTGEVASGLAHDPDGRSRRLLAAAGSKEEVVLERWEIVRSPGGRQLEIRDFELARVFGLARVGPGREGHDAVRGSGGGGAAESCLAEPDHHLRRIQYASIKEINRNSPSFRNVMFYEY